MTREWLSEDEQHAWRTYLRMGSLLPAALNRQLQQDCGLTLPEYEVLVQLSEAPGQRLRPFQICDALNWSRSRLSHQLTRMERRRLVTRRECAADGRGPSSSSPPPARPPSARPRPGTSPRCAAVLRPAERDTASGRSRSPARPSSPALPSANKGNRTKRARAAPVQDSGSSSAL